MLDSSGVRYITAALGVLRALRVVMLDRDRILRKEGLSAVLSLMVPGVGQIYNGDFARGAFWLLVTPGFWLGTGGALGWACHLTSAYTAHRRAARTVSATVES